MELCNITLINLLFLFFCNFSFVIDGRKKWEDGGEGRIVVWLQVVYYLIRCNKTVQGKKVLRGVKKREGLNCLIVYVVNCFMHRWVYSKIQQHLKFINISSFVVWWHEHCSTWVYKICVD